MIAKKGGGNCLRPSHLRTEGGYNTSRCNGRRHPGGAHEARRMSIRTQTLSRFPRLLGLTGMAALAVVVLGVACGGPAATPTATATPRPTATATPTRTPTP